MNISNLTSINSYNINNQKMNQNLSSLKNSEEKKLYEACVEFESIFVKQMLDSMKKTINKSGLMDGGMTEEIFDDMLYDRYATSISKNAQLGLAKQMFDQIRATL